MNATTAHTVMQVESSRLRISRPTVPHRSIPREFLSNRETSVCALNAVGWIRAFSATRRASGYRVMGLNGPTGRYTGQPSPELRAVLNFASVSARRANVTRPVAHRTIAPLGTWPGNPQMQGPGGESDGRSHHPGYPCLNSKAFTQMSKA